MGYRFECAVPIRWKDIDAEGLLNNAVYLSLVEQARWEYFHGLGVVVDERVPFVLLSVGARFFKPGRLGMEIVVAVRTSRLGGKSFDMEYEVRGDGERLVGIEARCVWLDETRRETIEIPIEVRRRLAEFESLSERTTTHRPQGR